MTFYSAHTTLFIYLHVIVLRAPGNLAKTKPSETRRLWENQVRQGERDSEDMA